jgi:hypothetical protein
VASRRVQQGVWADASTDVKERTLTVSQVKQQMLTLAVWSSFNTNKSLASVRVLKCYVLGRSKEMSTPTAKYNSSNKQLGNPVYFQRTFFAHGKLYLPSPKGDTARGGWYEAWLFVYFSVG